MKGMKIVILVLLILTIIALAIFAFILVTVFKNPNSSTSPLDSSQISQKDYREALIKISKPFNEKDIFLNTPNKTFRTSFALGPLMDCYLSDASQKETEEYQLIKELQSKNNIDWHNFENNDYDISEAQGYYETENCFAAYISPSKQLKLSNLDETAAYAEMIERRIFGDYIYPDRLIISAADNTKALSLSEHPEYGLSEFNTDYIFGFYTPTHEEVVINTDFEQNAYDDIFWRTLHEYHHFYTFGKNQNVIQSSRYSMPEEMFAEYMNIIISQKLSDPGVVVEIPASIKVLLNVLTEEEIVYEYFRGTVENMKDKVDSRTYDGAFCSYLYYVSASEDAYGRAINNNIEQVFYNPNLKIDPRNCLFFD
jgi:hypothetical protein